VVIGWERLREVVTKNLVVKRGSWEHSQIG